jgi:hypothetical protein
MTPRAKTAKQALHFLAADSTHPAPSPAPNQAQLAILDIHYSYLSLLSETNMTQFMTY